MAKKEKMLATKSGRKNVINCIIALIIAVVFLFPIYWILAMSFKTDAESFGKIVTYYPHEFTIDPWVKNLSDREFLNSLRNSAVIAVLSMVLSMVFGVPAAYGMGRYKVPGQKTFMLTFLVTQMLPASLMLTPMYLIFNKLHLLGTYQGPALAIASGTVPFIVVTLRPYFKSVPTSLDDAARIDGCGVFRSFFKIMIPAIKTGIITVVVISFLNGWNDLAYSMTFNVTPEMRPLTANIYKFKSKWGTKWNCIMAYGAILVLPVIVLIIFCILGMIYVGGFWGDSAGDFIAAFSNTDAYVALPWGGLVALVIAVAYLVARRVLTFKQAMECVPKGFIAMVPPITILTLAVSLKTMTNMLGADVFVYNVMQSASQGLFNLLPAVIFIVACLLAFASGTSWGTFGILIPIVVAIFDPSSPLLIIGISACLAGAVCGDHCSPISDTTIMASAGAQCDHVTHVSTQLPYAVTVACVSFVSFIIAGFVQNAVICLVIGAILMIATLFVIRSVTGKQNP